MFVQVITFQKRYHFTWPWFSPYVPFTYPGKQGFDYPTKASGRDRPSSASGLGNKGEEQTQWQAITTCSLPVPGTHTNTHAQRCPASKLLSVPDAVVSGTSTVLGGEGVCTAETGGIVGMEEMSIQFPMAETWKIESVFLLLFSSLGPVGVDFRESILQSTIIG